MSTPSIKEIFENKKSVSLLPELKEHCYTDPELKMLCIKHPLLFSIPHHPAQNLLCNVRFLRIKEQIEKSLTQKDWGLYIFTHERPYRLNAFLDLLNMPDVKIENREYWELLKEI